jgi:hypothetical protein
MTTKTKSDSKLMDPLVTPLEPLIKRTYSNVQATGI